jgi:hypothetical protein
VPETSKSCGESWTPIKWDVLAPRGAVGTLPSATGLWGAETPGNRGKPLLALRFLADASALRGAERVQRGYVDLQ